MQKQAPPFEAYELKFTTESQQGLIEFLPRGLAREGRDGGVIIIITADGREAVANSGCFVMKDKSGIYIYTPDEFHERYQKI